MTFQELLATLTKDFQEFKFVENDKFYWNHDGALINYKFPKLDKDQNRYQNKLLHELAHAKLEHSDYKSDAQLLKIESSAWKLAQEFCSQYKIKFNKKEQERSLASYITWASSRSRCPKCQKNGLQITQTEFLCGSCKHQWNVGTSRFTRTYRQSN